MGVDNLLGRPVDPTLLGMLRGIEGQETGVDLVAKTVKPAATDRLSRIVLAKKEVKTD
jgi:hypothetical protein